MELWRPITGYEKMYEISSLGRVRSLPRWRKSHPGKDVKSKLKGGLVKQTKAANGYYYFTASGNGMKRRYVKTNVLAARTFLGEPPEGYVCDHIDRNPLNNKIENLRYVSESENRRNSDRWDRASNIVYAHQIPRLNNKYRVYFNGEGKRVMFGSYKTSKDARKVVAKIRSRILNGESLSQIKESL